MINKYPTFDKALISWKHSWTKNLFSIGIVTDTNVSFLAGQYIRVAFMQDEELVIRPYSIASAPEQKEIELYVVTHEDEAHGAMSCYLSQLVTGDYLLIDNTAYGFLTLEEIPKADSLWLLSSGVGIAPFLSIVRTGAVFKRFSSVYLVHSTRFIDELGYAGELADLQQRYARFKYLPFVTRETKDNVSKGRITDALDTGLLETITNHSIDTSCHFMICGNPGLVDECVSLLKARGLERNRRRKPGHITVEKFW